MQMKGSRWQRLAERGVEEFRRFLVMFAYLWVAFGLFVLNENLIIGQHGIPLAPQGFALINAAIFAKVMLVAEDLRFGRRLDHLPMIYPTMYKSALLAVLFIGFHAVEETVVGAVAGKSLADSMPHIGGGTWQGGLLVWTIMMVSLMPFFALREIGQFLGEGQLWRLMFKPRPTPTADRPQR